MDCRALFLMKASISEVFKHWNQHQHHQHQHDLRRAGNGILSGAFASCLCRYATVHLDAEATEPFRGTANKAKIGRSMNSRKLCHRRLSLRESIRQPRKSRSTGLRSQSHHTAWRTAVQKANQASIYRRNQGTAHQERTVFDARHE